MTWPHLCHSMKSWATCLGWYRQCWGVVFFLPVSTDASVGSTQPLLLASIDCRVWWRVSNTSPFTATNVPTKKRAAGGCTGVFYRSNCILNILKESGRLRADRNAYVMSSVGPLWHFTKSLLWVSDWLSGPSEWPRDWLLTAESVSHSIVVNGVGDSIYL